LLDGTGHSLVPPDAVHDIGAEIVLHPAATLPDGDYMVSYRVISADSHPVAGTFLFAVGAGHHVTTGVAPVEDAWRTASTILRTLLYATLLPTAGGIMFLGLIGVRLVAFATIRRGLYILGTVAAATALTSLAVKGAQLSGAPTLLTADAWTAVFESSFALSMAAALLGLALIGIGMGRWSNRHLRLIALVGSAIAAASFALTGHSATVVPRWLGAGLTIGHVVPIAFWAGSLWPLIIVLYRTPDEAGDVFRRFSRLAVFAVGILVLCGVAFAALQLKTPAALAGSPYGLTLIGKLALVAGLLLIAAYNKWWLTPRLGERSNEPRTFMIRAIRGEALLVALIFSLTAGLSTTSPPRAVAQDHKLGGIIVQAVSGARQALIELRPAAAGHNELSVHLMADGKAIESSEVSVELSQAGAGIGPIRRPLTSAGGGHYVWDGTVPLPGLWQVRLEALISDFEKAVFTAELQVR
jgi:copper transport protein